MADHGSPSLDGTALDDRRLAGPPPTRATRSSIRPKNALRARSGLTLAPYIDRYTRERRDRREVEASTARQWRTQLYGFADLFGNRPVEKLSPRLINDYIATLSDHAPSTRRNKVQVLRQLTRWMIAEEYLRTDPFRGVRMPKVPRSVPRALTADEVDRLWMALPDQRARAMVALMVGMGLRRAEVISVEVGDWDRTGQTMRITGKGGHTRLLPVPEHVAVELDRYLQQRPAVAGVIIRRAEGRQGISNNYIGRLMREWLEDAGVKVAAWDGRGCHSLRHTLASNVADVQPDLRVLQAILGHVSLTSTQIYLRHAEMGKMREALDGAGERGEVRS